MALFFISVGFILYSSTFPFRSTFKSISSPFSFVITLSKSYLLFIFLLFTSMILSPASSPATCAEYPSIVESISLDTNVPAVEVSPKYKHTAKTIFTIAPANTIAILFGILALEKEPSFSDCSSSPSILTNPPSGINRIAYLVSFPCFFHIVGPKPIANSFTFTLHNFATVKCPNSCINIKNPNKTIIFIAIIKKLIKCFLLNYNNVNNAYANGAKNIKLSILSNIPPCPGIKLL